MHARPSLVTAALLVLLLAPVLTPLLSVVPGTAVIAAVTAPPRADPGPPGATSRPEAPVVRVVVKLEDGHLPLRELIAAAYLAAEIPVPEWADGVTWTVDVRTIVGRAQLDLINRVTGDIIAIDADRDALTVTLDRAALAAEVGGTRRATSAWLESMAARLGARPAGTRAWGITFFTEGEERVSPERFARRAEGMPERLVVLVHGLDDPGWMWDDVAPALRSAGHVVARMEYPNDGPIAESADLFALHLMDLRARGAERIDIVAHSMGGLVSRDVLTRDTLYAGRGKGGGAFPAVDRLIMCGTPNHGSQIARLRAFTEIRELVARVNGDDGSWLDGLEDGRGEAGTDLLPGSAFLRDLNARPAPRHTAYTIIAGRMSPLTEDDLDTLGRKVRSAARSARAPRWLRDWIATADREAQALAKEASSGLGDGCVSVDSARLEGVEDFVVVGGDHVGIILGNQDDGEPAPGIPIILDRLERKSKP